MRNPNPDHEALRDRLSRSRLTENDRTTLAHLLDQVRAATTLTEESPLEDQSVGFWWGTMAQYRELVPAQRDPQAQSDPAAADAAAIRADESATPAEQMIADAYFESTGSEVHR